jgi:hypothetical protein
MAAQTDVARGNMLGTTIVGAVEWFVATYGPAAGAALVAEMPAQFRGELRPNTRALGLLGSKRYSYAFVGAIVDTMGKVAHVPAVDPFIEQLAEAGIDAALGTAMRVVLRFAATPSRLAERAQEAWDMFHDCGTVHAVASDHDYVVTVTNWAPHDVTVCKISLYSRKRILMRGGLRDVQAFRDKCRGWGHDVCVHRVLWSK